MYIKFHQLFTENECNQILNAIRKENYKNENSHFINNGKKFFLKKSNFLILSNLVSSIFNKTEIGKYFNNCHVDHAFLLLKSSGGNATLPHQDRPYWINKEENLSMITCWIALDKINKNEGALKLSGENQTSFNNFNSNNQNLFDHKKKNNLDNGNFNYVINHDDIKKINLKTIYMEKGDAIFFDSLEVHSSEPNLSLKTRMAMKIVFRDKNGDYPTSELIKNPYKTYYKKTILNYLKK